MANAQSRTRRDHALWDRNVNDLWGGLRPILSPEESLTAARKLYRHATGKAWPGKWELVSGNRFTWPRRGVFYVNPDRTRGETGLRDIVHLVSHYCHGRLHRGDKPHSIRQLRLEARLTKFALARWGPGAVTKPDPVKVTPVPETKVKPDAVQLRFNRMVARRDKWQSELDRAERLLKKAEREVRAYRSRHKSRLVG